MTDRADQPEKRPGRRPPPPGTGKVGRGPFMALRDEIERDLLSGVAIVTVYERFQDRLGFSYSNFTKYVRRYLPNAVPKPGGEPGGVMTTPVPPPPSAGPSPAPPSSIVPVGASATPEPRQAPADDRPRRFTLERQSDDKLF